MSKSLNDFISEIKKDGLARQNRFSVLITTPKSLLNQQNNLELVQLFCEQAVLPSITFASQPIKTFGEDREVIYDRNFEDVTLTFLVDRNMYVKKFFDDWTDSIIDPYTRITGFYEQYSTRIIISVQDLNDKDVYTSVIYEAYPKNVAQIQLDNNSKDVMKMTVTFAYKYHINFNNPTAGGEPQVMSQFMPSGYNQNSIYSADTNINKYLQGSLTLPSISDSYFTNYKEYQQVVNDGFSARNAINLLEKSGVNSGIGGLFL